MRFSLTTPPFEKWLPFGAYRFVLPRSEVLARGDQTYLACNAIVRDGDGDLLATTLGQLDDMSFPGGDDPAPVARAERPGLP